MDNSLNDLIDDFLVYKRSVGYMYKTPESYLRRYERFVTEHCPSEILSEYSVREYVKTIESEHTVYLTINALREFGRYLNRRGIFAYVYSAKVGVPSPHEPYLFTQEEISEFFRAADSITPNPEFVGRELLLPAIFRTMYCCGLRTIEIVRLKRENVDFENMTITILNSKGPNSRLIYISNDLCIYLKNYDEKFNLIYPNRNYFFPGKKAGAPISESAISTNFRRIWTLAFPNFSGSAYPRPYDFRHHFACYNINKWAEEQMNTRAMIPYLSKYMGHSSINETLYYFHLTPDFYPTYREIAKTTEDILPEVPYEEK